MDNYIQEVAEFKKVSYIEFEKAMKEAFYDIYDEKEILRIYDCIKLPTRATKGSAGYDFYSPITFALENDEGQIRIPMGIRVEIKQGWFMAMIPRSGLGYKYGYRLNNTVGVIDEDYFGADNEGHISLKLCGALRNMIVSEGERIAQGIFLPYGIVKNDKPLLDVRNGGLGSTGI